MVVHVFYVGWVKNFVWTWCSAYLPHVKILLNRSMALKQKKVAVDTIPKKSVSLISSLTKFPTVPNGVTSSTEMESRSVNDLGLDNKKFVHRSSVICSAGFDKYTFDCHRNDIPVRSMGLELDRELAMYATSATPPLTSNLSLVDHNVQNIQDSAKLDIPEAVWDIQSDSFRSLEHTLKKRPKSMLLKRQSLDHSMEGKNSREIFPHQDFVYPQMPEPHSKTIKSLIKRESVVHPKNLENARSPVVNQDLVHSPTLEKKLNFRGTVRKYEPNFHPQLISQKQNPVHSTANLRPIIHVPKNEVSGSNPNPRSSYVKRDSVVHPGELDVQHSLCINGRFQNPWPTWHSPTITNILKFGLSKDKSNVPSKQELDLILPVVKPNFLKNSTPPEDGIRITWIGHSTVLIQMHGLNILTDPIFSDRASPSQVVGPKRYRDPPCSIHDLPHIDAVVISHTHYDHLDFNTVRLLNARFDTDIRWFVPSGLMQWMKQMGCDNVVELDWWEENCVPEHSDTFFIFTPAQHWSKRTIGDDNKVLWGSWCIIGPKYRFFFAGDTGYCEVFKQIGQIYGPFDVSAIPIGAYEPRWFMKHQHINPEEAVKVHDDVKSKYTLAIHWGTFCLANEYYLDPPMKLRDGLDQRGISAEYFFTLKHGETRLFAQGVPGLKEKNRLHVVKR